MNQKWQNIRLKFLNFLQWTSSISLILIFYIISIYGFFLFIRFFYYFIQNIYFVKWARKQNLVLISGSPSSGKKLLLTFLNDNLKMKDYKYYNLLCFFNNNKSYDVFKKEWKNSYLIKDFYKKNKTCFLIDEVEDNSFNLLPERWDLGKEKIISEISNSNYFNSVFWLAFSSRDGLLWNKLYSRSSLTIECNGIEKVSLKYFKFYLLRIIIKENQKDLKKRTILINEKTFLKYKNSWLKEFLIKAI